MADVSATGNVLSDLSIANKTREAPKSNELGQSAFLELMVTQLNNQDPLKPQENGEFVAQLAQFSSVEGIERLNQSFDGFSANFRSNQALQASSLVGRTVTVPTDKSILEEGGAMTGNVSLPASTTDMRLKIYSGSGTLIQEIPAGPQQAGEKAIRWDGLNLSIDGKPVNWLENIPEDQRPGKAQPGEYTVKVFALQGGKTEQLETALGANVNSVTVDGKGGLTLNLSGIGPVSLDKVKQFN